jgi:FkbM family methyltransferase
MLPGSKKTVLERLLRDGLQFDYVLDVGILYQTHELRELFPHIKQYLFEPVSDFHPAIRRHYANNDYELIEKAVGEAPGEFRMIQHSVKDGEKVTHSRIARADERLKSNETETLVDVITLDDFVTSRGLVGRALLKIDVDGNEPQVIAGASEALKSCVCVIVEANKFQLPLRLHELSRHGFVLYDICDLCFYDDVFIQLDLVLLNKALVDVHAFNPIARDGGVRMEHWKKL